MMLSLKLYAVIGFAFLAIGGAAYWQYTVANTLREDLATSSANQTFLEGEIKDLNDTVLAVSEEYAEQIERQENLNEELKGIRYARDKTVYEYNEFRSKLARVARKNPERVGVIASRATRNIMCGFESATGGDCKQED